MKHALEALGVSVLTQVPGVSVSDAKPRRGRSSESGQVVVLLVAFVPVLLGAAAMVLDVGSWYRADRAAQAAADAAALAGAQELPATDAASALANEYAAKNGGGDLTISFSTRVIENDVITVTVSRPAPGFFSKLFGIDSVEVEARASARAGIPGEAQYVAPIVVSEQHPMLECGEDCFGEDHPTQITLSDLHRSGSGDAAGAFGLLNLESQHTNGDPGNGTLADWLLNGYQDSLPLGTYRSAPSATFNSSAFRSALDARIGTELLFPVYRSIERGGSQAEYDIVAWVGFVPTSFTIGGSHGAIEGYFTEVIWQGLADESGDVPDLGVRTISLIE
ncbi:MAG TPA: pilus assembly protein TadG-related protein [Gaiellaceae bacterium]|jgi:hypothetical protein|nr:pilus assembly protein TadG-related protein [Gaiellaceae bacterium]